MERKPASIFLLDSTVSQLVPHHRDYGLFGCDGVGAAHFGAGFFGCEHPFDACAGGVALFLPCGNFADEALGVVDSAIQALAAEHADLDLDHVEPAGMLRTIGAGLPSLIARVARLSLQSRRPPISPPKRAWSSRHGGVRRAASASFTKDRASSRVSSRRSRGLSLTRMGGAIGKSEIIVRHPELASRGPKLLEQLRSRRFVSRRRSMRLALVRLVLRSLARLRSRSILVVQTEPIMPGVSGQLREPRLAHSLATTIPSKWFRGWKRWEYGYC